MRHLLLLACLLLTLNGAARAEQRLFYQPLNSDATLSAAQWQGLWQASRAQGVETLVVQWTRYGSDDFGGAQGWLAEALRAAQQAGLHLVLGLHMDPAYYRRLDELDGPGLESYWQYQLGLSVRQQQRLRQDWHLDVQGWYLPLELDDLHFLAAERRQVLQRQLRDFAGQLDAPLQLSAFASGRLAPTVYADWLQQIAGLGIQPWWQDGSGTGQLSATVRQAYASALPCGVGIVREAFRQTSAASQAFQAQPLANLPAARACHPDAVFELRYRPWGEPLRRAALASPPVRP
ncbi:MAG: hypothetical protein GAK43_00542 [Stenotrophomonas maltophilia]|nr:MAG: hypothetical protein GAK43_00542 [Stenotrophomonas maltophilia]